MALNKNQDSVGWLIENALQLYRSGNLKAAKAEYSNILKRHPGNAEALHFLGCVNDDLGNSGQAIKLLLQAVKANPKAHAYFYNLANMQMRQGNAKDAIGYYREAISLKPNYAIALNNLGRALAQTEQREEAKRAFKDAISQNSEYADPHYNLGIELKAGGFLDDAVCAFLAAIQIKPDFDDAYCNLGGVYLRMQLVSQAVSAYEKAVEIQPRSARNQSNLGSAWLRVGRQKEAIEALNKAVALDPEDAFTSSNLILATTYVTPNASDIYAQSRNWDRLHGSRFSDSIKRHTNLPIPERRLRIGYVSADFRSHAASYWIEPILSNSQHNDLEIFCYSNCDIADTTTERLKRYADTWVECARLDDDALASRIRRDAIDILVDLSGHTEGHRLLVFARQPAPVQVSWFGFPASTGMHAMQYRFTDAVIDPPGESEGFNSEKLIWLSRFYAAFRPEPNAPSVGDGPVTSKGFITFASLNSFAKITPDVLRIWADLLVDVPNSKLLLQAAGLEGVDLAEHICHIFAERGVDPDRLLLRGWTKMDEFLYLGEEVDIVLDPFPFNGGVTTCHALWMGLPVITMRGNSAASRVGGSILSRMGLMELIANDTEEYRTIAKSLAQDLSKLSMMRASLRTRMSASFLLDGVGLAAEVEVAFRTIWRTWCDGR